MVENNFFDDLELRSETQRNQDHLKQLIKLIQEAKKNKNQSLRLDFNINDLSDFWSRVGEKT